MKKFYALSVVAILLVSLLATAITGVSVRSNGGTVTVSNSMWQEFLRWMGGGVTGAAVGGSHAGPCNPGGGTGSCHAGESCSTSADCSPVGSNCVPTPTGNMCVTGNTIPKSDPEPNPTPKNPRGDGRDGGNPPPNGPPPLGHIVGAAVFCGDANTDGFCDSPVIQIAPATGGCTVLSGPAIKVDDELATFVNFDGSVSAAVKCEVTGLSQTVPTEVEFFVDANGDGIRDYNARSLWVRPGNGNDFYDLFIEVIGPIASWSDAMKEVSEIGLTTALSANPFFSDQWYINFNDVTPSEQNIVVVPHDATVATSTKGPWRRGDATIVGGNFIDASATGEFRFDEQGPVTNVGTVLENSDVTVPSTSAAVADIRDFTGSSGTKFAVVVTEGGTSVYPVTVTDSGPTTFALTSK